MSSNATSHQQTEWGDRAFVSIVSLFKRGFGTLKNRVDSWLRSYDQEVLESTLARISEACMSWLPELVGPAAPPSWAFRILIRR